MTLGIDEIVRVSASIAPSGTIREEFGRTLLLTPNAGLPATGPGRVRTFSIMEQVAEVFPEDSEPYQAARVYFSQSPYPRPLLIGRWAEFGEPSRLEGGTPLPLEEITGESTTVRGTGTVAALAMLQAITTGTLTFLGASLTGLNFSTATDLDGVASLLQTALRGTSAVTVQSWGEVSN